MQNYADRANDLIERIDDGEIDPADVDITPFVEREDAILTRGLADRLPEEKIDEYNRRVRRRDESDLQEKRAELSAEARNARDTLLNVGRSTATVDLATLDNRLKHPVEIEVRTEITGRAERRLLEVQDLDDFDQKLEAILDVIEEIVVGPEGYNERQAWRDVWEERGTKFLRDCMELMIQPSQEEIKQTKSFREDN